jgi:hypothetical protein
MSNKLTARRKASRANGALGRGRKTEEGRKRSSFNALKHGLLSGTVVLSTESEPRFELLLNQLAERLRPNDQVETGIVLEMAASTWRLRRLWQIETHLMNDAMNAAATETDPFPRTAKAFSKLASGPDLDLIDRYESRLHRIYHRSLLNLVLLRDIDRTLDERPNPRIEDLEEEEIEQETNSKTQKTQICQTKLDPNNPSRMKRLPSNTPAKKNPASRPAENSRAPTKAQIHRRRAQPKQEDRETMPKPPKTTPTAATVPHRSTPTPLSSAALRLCVKAVDFPTRARS